MEIADLLQKIESLERKVDKLEARARGRKGYFTIHQRNRVIRTYRKYGLQRATDLARQISKIKVNRSTICKMAVRHPEIK